MSENKLWMNKNPLIWNIQLFRQMVVIYGKWYSIRRTICCTDVNVFLDFGRPVLSQCFSDLSRPMCMVTLAQKMSPPRWAASHVTWRRPKSHLSESLCVSGPHTLAASPARNLDPHSCVFPWLSLLTLVRLFVERGGKRNTSWSREQGHVCWLDHFIDRISWPARSTLWPLALDLLGVVCWWLSASSLAFICVAATEERDSNTSFIKMTWSFFAQSTLGRASPQSGEGPADQRVQLSSPLLANSQFHPNN